jgi:hypothetical protein
VLFLTPPSGRKPPLTRWLMTRTRVASPAQPTPSGVESTGPPGKPAHPSLLGASNRTRGNELRRLWSLVRTASERRSPIFWLLPIWWIPWCPRRELLPLDERTRTFVVLHDLTHTVIDHSVRITEQSVFSRRTIATQALNLADRPRWCLPSWEMICSVVGGGLRGV